MYIPHDNFPQPPDTAKVWRYFDLGKLLSLVTERKLYFASVSLLKTIDPREGVWPESDYRRFAKNPEDIKQFKEISDFFAEITFVNCWHLNEYESDAMWHRFGNQFAVQSTFGRLKESFPDDKIHAGKVVYIDHFSDLIHRRKKKNGFLLSMRKHKSFDSEREIRVILPEYPPYDLTQDTEYPYRRKGVSINVDVENLIETVFVSNKLPEWTKDLLVNILEKYELDNLAIEKSVLN